MKYPPVKMMVAGRTHRVNAVHYDRTTHRFEVVDATTLPKEA